MTTVSNATSVPLPPVSQPVTQQPIPQSEPQALQNPQEIQTTPEAENVQQQAQSIAPASNTLNLFGVGTQVNSNG